MKLDTRVLIVGCGAAGVTAAIGLARRKIPVVVVEGATYPGAENWSGAVYFCENLARPEILGEDLLAQSPIERRVVRRGLLMTDGRVAPGLAVRSPEAFSHCYTVLRPVFDHDLAQKARLLGAEILNDTTALALIRDGDQVLGVLTDRGPIHASVVFLAEGDASNLVTREGLETKAPGPDGLARPEFLQGIKEVLELPAETIERRFGVSAGEGACFEILLRNAALDGQPVPLNAGAFLYTNRESVSLGLVAPLQNLAKFKGAHNQLMEWFKGLPAIAPLLEGARPVSFGAKLIRGGGWREMPRLVLPGLCVGGAAGGLGVDFPCPNYTGPATFSGFAFSEAVHQILEQKQHFSRESLEGTYVRRIQESWYLKDSWHLAAWPHFVASSREFFGRQVDLVAGAAEVATRASGGPVGRRLLLGRLLHETLPLRKVGGFAREMRAADATLGIFSGWWKDIGYLFPWWVVNLVIGWWPRRTATGARLEPLLLHDGKAPRRPMFLFWRWLRWRLAPGLAEALHHLYRNDGTPLARKMPLVRQAILTRLSLLDFVLLPLAALATWLWGALDLAAFALRVKLGRPALDAILRMPWFRFREESRALTDLRRARIAVDHDRKLAMLTYRGDATSHIHWHAAYDADGIPDNAGSPLFSVCPARVYQEETDQSLGTSVAVLHENCIRCESCWRADDRRVDWGRTGGHRLTFEAYTPADAWLAETREAAGLADVQRVDREAADPGEAPHHPVARIALPEDAAARAAVHAGRAVRHARSFSTLLRESPAVLSGADQALIALLGGEVLSAVADLADGLRPHAEGDAAKGLRHRLLSLDRWRELAAPRLASRRFFHLDADLGLLLRHHLPDLEARTGIGAPPRPERPKGQALRRAAIRELIQSSLTREVIAAGEDVLRPPDAARRLVISLALGLLRETTDGIERPGSAPRDVVLEELARVWPALAVVLARHLAALDLLLRPAWDEPRPGGLDSVRAALREGRLLAGVVEGGFRESEDGALEGGWTAALLGGAELLVFVLEDGLAVAAPGDAGIVVETTGAIGLRGAGPGRIRCDRATPRLRIRGAGAAAALGVRSAWDLVAIARGMARELATRALDHAASRVQFPGLFRDLRGRDGIAKFGAVQDMLAGITQNLEILEGLAGRVGHGRIAAALALDLLGPSPRSVAYLAGQVLGGTAFSEEDAVCRSYRDASALTRLPLAVSEAVYQHGQRVVLGLRPGTAEMPDLEWKVGEVLETGESSPLIAPHLRRVQAAAGDVTRALREAAPATRQALAADLGRLGLHVLGVRCLADRAAASLAAGMTDGVLPAALEGFSARVAARATKLARRIEDVPSLLDLGRMALAARPGARTGAEAGAAGAAYPDFLGDGSTFQSGDLLLRPGGGASLAYTPELLESDPDLRRADAEAVATWRARFGGAGGDGVPYTRRVERAHHVPLADIAFLLDRGAFRMVIPESLGGLGLKKVFYYIACSRMMRHGDPAQSLIVMGSSSIGTTPILIGLEQDLLAARAALEEILAAREKVQAVRDRILEIRRKADTPEVLKLAEPMKLLAADVKATLQKGKALRLVFGRFLDAFQAAGLAGMRRDLPAFKSGLESAAAALGAWEDAARRELAALPHRAAAHEWFLKSIASGRISAFALTEPSAGSDTARIRTRAELREVEVRRDPRGFCTFVPDAGSGAVRNLFTFDSLEFKDGRLHFIRPDRNRVPVEVRDFDYEAASAGQATAGKHRYVVLDGERVDIHDIGRVEKDGAREVYRHWRVNGAKMWITNGSIAGVMVLYARTAAGPTGFMLDAHAEGLVIGKDEHKMGQRGSATNELALSDVRIPADAVIGIEGRGQENALETLNVGRAGLAICAVGLMHEILDDTAAALAGAAVRPDQVIELGRMALDVAGHEALAHQLVGRFDHPGTKTPRMESAMAKASCSEALHRLITRAERVLPAEFALDLHEMEKRRRDARVLTIYEGTNEVQRFLLLKDLIDALDLERFEASARAGDPAAVAGLRDGLDAERRKLVDAIRDARSRWGSRAWQQVQLQPCFFPLVEQAMRCAAAGAAAHRLAVAHRLLTTEAGRERLEWLGLATRLLAADLPRWGAVSAEAVEHQRRRLQAGADPLPQALADRALLRHAAGARARPAAPKSRWTGTLRVAVVVDPRPVVAPRPRLAGGRLREPLHALSDEDRGALRAVLALGRSGPVSVTVLTVGSPVSIDVAEETLALGADRAVLLDCGGRNLLATDIASGLADLLRAREEVEGAGFDLVAGAASSSGFLLPLARRLDAPALPGVEAFGVVREGEAPAEITARLARGGERATILLPAVVLVDRPVTAGEWGFTADGWRRARTMAVPVIDFLPDGAPEVRLEAAASAEPEAAAAVAPAEVAGVADAARRFAAETGLDAGGAGGGPFEGPCPALPWPAFLEGLAALAVVEAEAGGALLSGARGALSAAAAVAARRRGPAGALVLLPDAGEAAARAAAGLALAVSGDLRIGLLGWRGLADQSHLGRARLLELALAAWKGPVFFAPELRPAALMAGEGRNLGDGRALLVDGVDGIRFRNGTVMLQGLRFDRRVRFSTEVAMATAECQVVCTADLVAEKGEDAGGAPASDKPGGMTEGPAVPEAPAEAAAGLDPGVREVPRVAILEEFPLPVGTDALAHVLRSATKALGASLADAEFIIDVGYGVGSRDGIEEVIDPLKAALERLGIRRVTIGATRKVTLDLGILPDSCQIGQTGTAVNPRVLLAVGVSGAPQHLEYIGSRAVVFAFNKDPEAPLLVLNRTRPRPVVYPILGDLFTEVPAFVRALEAHLRAPAAVPG